jgi:hypothetical protein
MKSLKIICPNGHLGFAPIRVESFGLGVASRPDYIAADWQRTDRRHQKIAAAAATRATAHNIGTRESSSR